MHVVTRAMWRTGMAVVTAVAVVLLGVPFVPPAQATSFTLTATGRAIYHDHGGDPHPIPGALVQMCDDDTPFGDCEVMDEAHTAADGTFELEGAGGDFDGSPDVYIRVIADSDAGAVQLETGVGFITYCMATDKTDDYNPNSEGFSIELGDISPASTNSCGIGVGPGGSFADIPTEEAAWELLDYLTSAYEFTVDEIGTIDPVSLLWPSTLNGVPFYLPLPPTIRVNPPWETSKATIYHEYGHHVLYSFAESPVPDYGNDTCDETNPLAFLPFFGGHCGWEEENGSIHWTEGFPSFFAMAVSESLTPGSTPYTSTASDDVTEIDYETPFLPDGSPASPAGQAGARIEGWTTAILYDLWDPNDDNHDAATDIHGSSDQSTYTFADIWAAIQVDPDPSDDFHSNPTTIREFHDIFVDLHPASLNQINGLFTENLVAYRGADMYVTDVAIEPGVTEFFRGETYTFDAVTHNRAGVATNTGQRSLTAISLVDESSSIPTSYEFFDPFKDFAVPVLEPGDSHPDSGSFGIPLEVPPGVYRLRACADVEGVVFETAPTALPFTAMFPNCVDGPEVDVLNRAPVADTGGPYEVDEGTVVLDGSDSYDPDGDPVTYAWDPQGHSVLGSLSDAELTLVDIDDGTHQVSLTVNDGFDSSTSDAADITVNNLVPIVEIGADLAADEGSEVTQMARANDPGPDTMTATVDWGDLSPIEPLGSVSGGFDFSHTYTDEGRYTGELCVTDDDGGKACTNFEANIHNVVPVLDSDPVLAAGTEGSEVSSSVGFTDAGSDDWTATIDYGDGTIDPDVPLSSRNVPFAHTYADDGTFNGSICVDDGDGGTDCAVLTVSVINAVPVVSLTPPEPILALVDASIYATFTDAGVDDTHTAVIDWGDGSTDDPATLSSQSAGPPGVVTGSHVYHSSGEVTISVCVRDEADTDCSDYTTTILSPTEALEQAIGILTADATDPFVAQALKELNGMSTPKPGALQKLDEGDVISAITKIGKAIDALGKSPTDYTSEVRTLTVVVESIARSKLLDVEALGLISKGELAKVDRIRTGIEEGRTSFEGSLYSSAVDSYLAATRRAMTFL